MKTSTTAVLRWQEGLDFPVEDGPRVFLIKEGTNQLIYINSTGLFGSVGKEKTNKLKAILSDDEMSVATLESGIKRRLSVKELKRVIQEYNERNYNRK